MSSTGTIRLTTSTPSQVTTYNPISKRLPSEARKTLVRIDEMVEASRQNMLERGGRDEGGWCSYWQARRAELIDKSFRTKHVEELAASVDDVAAARKQLGAADLETKKTLSNRLIALAQRADSARVRLAALEAWLEEGLEAWTQTAATQTSGVICPSSTTLRHIKLDAVTFFVEDIMYKNARVTGGFSPDWDRDGSIALFLQLFGFTQSEMEDAVDVGGFGRSPFAPLIPLAFGDHLDHQLTAAMAKVVDFAKTHPVSCATQGTTPSSPTLMTPQPTDVPYCDTLSKSFAMQAIFDHSGIAQPEQLFASVHFLLAAQCYRDNRDKTPLVDQGLSYIAGEKLVAEWDELLSRGVHLSDWCADGASSTAALGVMATAQQALDASDTWYFQLTKPLADLFGDATKRSASEVHSWIQEHLPEVAVQLEPNDLDSIAMHISKRDVASAAAWLEDKLYAGCVARAVSSGVPAAVRITSGAYAGFEAHSMYAIVTPQGELQISESAASEQHPLVGQSGRVRASTVVATSNPRAHLVNLLAMTLSHGEGSLAYRVG